MGDYLRAATIHAPQVYSEPGSRKLLALTDQFSQTLPEAVFRNFFRGEPARDVRPLLPGLRVPTLVLHGEEDRLVPVEAGRWIAGQIPGAQFYAFRGRGHALIQTATAEFAQVLRSFVRAGRPA